MSDYTTRFIQLAIQAKALQFGEFILKSGRISPYFFNAGVFHTNIQIASLASCYADAVDQSGLRFDVIFGPAYKGIPLATALACEYAKRQRDVAIAFNRKEVKDHGEGGRIVGADLNARRILIIDDVITAGTAIRQSISMIRTSGGEVAGIVVALDRQEINVSTDRRSAIQAIAQSEQIPIIAIATLKNLLTYSQTDNNLTPHFSPLQAYQTRYCVIDSKQ